MHTYLPSAAKNGATLKSSLFLIGLLTSLSCHSAWELYWSKSGAEVTWWLNPESQEETGNQKFKIITSFSYLEPFEVIENELIVGSGTVSFELDCSTQKYRGLTLIGYNGLTLSGHETLNSKELYGSDAIDVRWRTSNEGSHIGELMKRLCKPSLS